MDKEEEILTLLKDIQRTIKNEQYKYNYRWRQLMFCITAIGILILVLLLNVV